MPWRHTLTWAIVTRTAMGDTRPLRSSHYTLHGKDAGCAHLQYVRECCALLLLLLEGVTALASTFTRRKRLWLISGKPSLVQGSDTLAQMEMLVSSASTRLRDRI